MRLVKQTQLFFKQGTSDKVYEVDLCEAGVNEFIVNFRYGRRGARLKEGTKTAFPVPHDEAQKVFDKLVDSKVKKGYRSGATEFTEIESDAAPATVQIQATELPQLPHIRRYLQKAIAGHRPTTWSLSRILWRAGEVGPQSLLKYLVQVPVQNQMEAYSLAWALGKSGSEDAVSRLNQLKDSGDEKTKRMGTLGLLSCLPKKDSAPIRQGLVARLPVSLQSQLGDKDELSGALENLLQNGPAPHEYLYTLYLLSDQDLAIKEVLYKVLKVLPFKAPWFKAIRHIFKAAEFRVDSDLFGLIAWRFEKNAGSFNAPWGYMYQVNPQTNRYDRIELATELKKPDSRFGYSATTRNYMRRRVVRNLRRAGDLNDPQTFITLATSVLMHYDDETDKKPVSQYTQWNWDPSARRYSSTEHYYGPYSNYLPLNFLLFENSERYYNSNNKKWASMAGFRPSESSGDTLPDKREEAFPLLWNAAPDALELLLGNSKCGIVHEFAAKVWKDNPAFNKRAKPDFIKNLISKSYAVTQDLAVDMAQRLFDAAKPDSELILSLLGCTLDRARELALSWVQSCRTALGKDAGFLARAILLPFEDVHADLRSWIGVRKPAKSILDAIIPDVVAGLLGFDNDDQDTAEDFARKARETLVMISGERLGDMSHEVIGQLLQHPVIENQILGAQSLSLSKEKPETIPDQLWELLFASPSSSVREFGMELFGRLGDKALSERADILASFCLSDKEDIRAAARPIVERLAKKDAAFGRNIVQQFYPIVLRKEDAEGLHEDVYQLLSGPLEDHLHVIPSDSCFKMMACPYSAGQKLGFLILQKFIKLEDVPVREIAKLGGQEHLDGREYIWAYYRENISRICGELGDAVRIMDTGFEDTLSFARGYFREDIKEVDWSPEALISLCDSPRAAMQDFGRELITRYFKEENGQEYLLKLSQHPTTELQTFATNYLERFASGDLEKIQKLEPYFVTVLSQINKGRVSKDRILKFLETEAIADRPTAEFIMPILERVSATVAIRDKAQYIKTMRNLMAQWSGLAGPLVRVDAQLQGTG